MIRFDAQEIGSYTVKQKDKKYRISMRSGNCDSVHIWYNKEDNTNNLFNFVADGEHLRNMMKHGVDIFKDCTNISLNMFFAQNQRLMTYATKLGHSVRCYYKEIK